MFEWNDGTYLYHYGIQGMKWGVRRWQNPDGTFNEEGKKRYFGERDSKRIESEKRASLDAVISQYNDAIQKRNAHTKAYYEECLSKVDSDVRKETRYKSLESLGAAAYKTNNPDLIKQYNKYSNQFGKYLQEDAAGITNALKIEAACREFVDDWIDKYGSINYNEVDRLSSVKPVWGSRSVSGWVDNIRDDRAHYRVLMDDGSISMFRRK